MGVSVPGRLEAQLPLSFANGKTKVISGPYRRACYRFHEIYSSSTAREDFRDPGMLQPRCRPGRRRPPRNEAVRYIGSASGQTADRGDLAAGKAFRGTKQYWRTRVKE